MLDQVADAGVPRSLDIHLRQGDRRDAGGDPIFRSPVAVGDTHVSTPPFSMYPRYSHGLRGIARAVTVAPIRSAMRSTMSRVWRPWLCRRRRGGGAGPTCPSRGRPDVGEGRSDIISTARSGSYPLCY